MPDKCLNWALRIIGLWGNSDYKRAWRSLVQPLLIPGSAVRSDQVVQGFAQPDLETAEHGAWTTSLGNLFYCLPVLKGKKDFPFVQSDFHISISAHCLPSFHGILPRTNMKTLILSFW